MCMLRIRTPSMLLRLLDPPNVITMLLPGSANASYSKWATLLFEGRLK